MIMHYLVQPFVSKQETRNAGKRSLAEHFCGQAFEGLQCRADRRVRSVDQWCQQRLGYILLGHRYQAHTSSIRYRNNASAKGARQKSWKSAKDKAAGFVNIINYIIYISIQNNVLNECVIFYSWSLKVQWLELAFYFVFKNDYLYGIINNTVASDLVIWMCFHFYFYLLKTSA